MSKILLLTLMLAVLIKFHFASGKFMGEQMGSCDYFGTCSQICISSPDGSECSCMKGFKLSENGWGCNPIDTNLTLIYATETRLGIIARRNKGTEVVPLLRNNSSVNGLTLDTRNEAVYFINKTEYGNAINRLGLQESANFKVIADLVNVNLTSVAFDWLTGNIYFVDNKYERIGICRNDSRACAVVVEEACVDPKDIAVHPNLGVMFWTCGRANSSIQRSGMDGSDSHSIITTGHQILRAITIDYANSRIYWLNPFLQRIESSYLDGKDRKFTISDPSLDTTRAIDLFGDRIYWSNFETVLSAEKFNGSNQHVHVDKFNLDLCAISVFHVAKQPIPEINPCTRANCSHMCAIGTKERYKCLCPAGRHLDNNNKTCLEWDTAPRLIFALGGTISSVLIGTIEKRGILRETFSLHPKIKGISALVYNPVNHTLLVSDTPSKSIYEYQLHSKRLRVLVDAEVEVVHSLDIDVVGDVLYWVDSGRRTIEALSLRTGARILIRNDIVNVQDILVASDEGLLYLSTNDGGKNREILKMPLNGSHSPLLTKVKATEPMALAYERSSKLIFSADKVNRVLKDASLLRNQTYPVSVPFQGAPSARQQVYSADMCTRKAYVTQPPIARGLDWLLAYEEKSSDFHVGGKITLLDSHRSALKEELSTHDCSLQNPNRKRCSHACLLTTVKLVGVCRCPEDMTLGEDGVTCHLVTPPVSEAPVTTPSSYLNATTENVASEPPTDDAEAERKKVVIVVVVVVCPMLLIAIPVVMFILQKISFRRSKVRIVVVEKTVGDTLTAEDVRQFREGTSGQVVVQSNEESIYTSAYVLPYDESFEIPKDQLTIDHNYILGSGQFGHVFKALINLPQEGRVEVALKVANDNSPPSTIRGMLSEIKIMIYMGKHEHIVGLIGAYTAELQQGIVYIATDLCGKGSLLGYLRKQKTLTGAHGPTSPKDDKGPINRYQMLQWAQEIAKGMEYLGEKNIVHADLATRNVFLDGDKTAKIGDFGLARRMFQFANYKKESQEPLPWRWMAIESLKTSKFSTKSDVWSYGVTLWEIFTLGDAPYPGLSWTSEFADELEKGLRPGCPAHAPSDIYQLMVHCWSPKSKDRPTFSRILLIIDDILGLNSTPDHDYFNIGGVPMSEVQRTTNLYSES